MGTVGEPVRLCYASVMPLKLIVLLVLMSLSAIGSFVLERWVLGGFQVLLVVLIGLGREGARKALIGLSILNIGVVATMAVLAFIAYSDLTAHPRFGHSAVNQAGTYLQAMIVLGASLVPPLLAIWVLTRRDVQWWMYKRSTGQTG